MEQYGTFPSPEVQIENPQCLGNLTSGKTERLHGAPYYVSLKRLTNLTPMKLNIAQNSIKRVVKNVSNGKFTCFFHVSTNITGSSGNVMSPVLRFAFGADSNENVDLGCELNVIGGCKFSSHTVGVEKSMEVTMLPIPMKEIIARSLSKESAQELRVRCTHQVLRTHGLEIVSTLLGKDHFIEFAKICKFIASYWILKKEYENACDAYMVEVDVAIKLGRNEIDIGNSINKLAELYESMGQVKVGANLYVSALTFYLKDADPSVKYTTYCNAGLAFKNCEELVQGEEMYIRAWKIGAPDITECANLVINIVMFYYKIAVEKVNDGDYSLPIDNIHPILCALFKQAGIRSTGMTGKAIAGADCTQTLLPEFRNKEASLRVLRNAANIPSRKAFREAIASTCGTIFMTFSQGYENRSLKDKKKHARGIRKEHVKSVELFVGGESVTSRNTMVPNKCSMCDAKESKSGKKLQCCPCEIVYYCCKDCQNKHWKQHKNYCPVYIKKQQKAKNEQNSSADQKKSAIEDSACLEKKGKEQAAAETEGENVVICNKCGSSKIPPGKETLLKCPCNGSIYYCSKACQRADWKAHRTVHNSSLP